MSNFLPNSVGDVVVVARGVPLLRVVVVVNGRGGALFLFRCVAALGRLLFEPLLRLPQGTHLLCDLPDVAVGLLQQELQAVVLGLLHQFSVGGHVVRPESLQAPPRGPALVGLLAPLDLLQFLLAAARTPRRVGPRRPAPLHDLLPVT